MGNRRKLTREERREVYNKFDGHCAYCGRQIGIRQMQVDHFLPLRCGGADELYNMVPSCRMCNENKGKYTVNQFRHNIENVPWKLCRDFKGYLIAKKYGIIKEVKKPIVFYYEKQQEYKHTGRRR